MTSSTMDWMVRGDWLEQRVHLGIVELRIIVIDSRYTKFHQLTSSMGAKLGPRSMLTKYEKETIAMAETKMDEATQWVDLSDPLGNIQKEK